MNKKGKLVELVVITPVEWDSEPLPGVFPLLMAFMQTSEAHSEELSRFVVENCKRNWHRFTPEAMAKLERLGKEYGDMQNGK